MIKFKIILHLLWILALPLFLWNVFLYFVGSFVAWDMNPYNWFIFTDDYVVFGRVMIICVECMILMSTQTFWKIFNDDE